MKIAMICHILLMMIKKVVLLINLQAFLFATFSIVAVDRNTKEVGSAGGSCIANSIIISDIHPNVGAIHTQSYWLSANQSYASSLMSDGFSPDEIIDLLESNDAQNNPTIRQYGIVDLFQEYNYGFLYENECNEIEGTVWDGVSGSGELAECADSLISRSATFTGSNCSDWKGHINGIDYAIQGNILLSEDILINMEEGFNNTNGSLDQKLMAALEGAKVPGADTRCMDEGISTLSAFIRVARPNDNSSELYMDLNVNSVIPYYSQNGIWIDPIDTLHTLYNNWYINEFDFDVGDINQDYIIDILDIVILVNFVLGENPIGLEYYLSDLNQDDIINIQDIIIIINFILN